MKYRTVHFISTLAIVLSLAACQSADEPAKSMEVVLLQSINDSLPPNYQNNWDGTITDRKTGLTWLQRPSNEKLSWEEAGEYCETLIFAGRDDWRLPSLKELITLADLSAGQPYICGDPRQQQFWSCNFIYGDSAHEVVETAFCLDYGTGQITASPVGEAMEMPEERSRDDSNSRGDSSGGAPPGGGSRGAPSGGGPQAGGSDVGGEQGGPPKEMTRENPDGKYVWAVRGDDYGINDFFDNGDGTVTDLATGLMWMKEDSGEELDWEGALAYGENLEFAGYDDWKLPNVKELQGIADYSGVFPAINSNVFEITDKKASCWTSTWPLFVAFGDFRCPGAVFGVDENDDYFYNYARAVREVKK